MPSSLLSDELLVRCHVRAERADRSADALAGDLAELSAAGFFRQTLPGAEGAEGWSLAELAREVRRLAYYAPLAADAALPHCAWVGTAGELRRAGNRSLDWLLEEAARDVLVAGAYGEPGNDAPLLGAGTRVEQVDGGYRLSGQKLRWAAPGTWGLLAVHGVLHTPDGAEHLLFAFLPRHTEGFAVRERIGPGGTSDVGVADVLLDGAFVADRYAVRTSLGSGVSADPLMTTLVAWWLLLQANIASARARRAFDLTVDAMHRTPSARSGGTLAQAPTVQDHLARMALALEAGEPLLDRLARQWSRGVRSATRWPVQLLSAHEQAHTAALTVIEQASELMACTPHTRGAGLDGLRDGIRRAQLQTLSSAAARRMIGRYLVGLPPA